MPECTLVCVSPESAAKVARDADRPSDPDHAVHQDGSHVIITYSDARFALDVADWAFQQGHASDAEAASTIASLQ